MSVIVFVVVAVIVAVAARLVDMVVIMAVVMAMAARWMYMIVLVVMLMAVVVVVVLVKRFTSECGTSRLRHVGVHTLAVPACEILRCMFEKASMQKGIDVFPHGFDTSGESYNKSVANRSRDGT